MTQPITWRNINSPSFGASNSLLNQSTQLLGTSINNLGNKLIAKSEDNKKEATEELKGRIAGITDYNELQNAREGIMAEMQGQNIDEEAVADFFNKQQTTLGNYITDGQQREINAFKLATQEEDRDLERERIRSNMAYNKVNMGRVTSPEEEAQLAAVAKQYTKQNPDGSVSFDDTGYAITAQEMGLPMNKITSYVENYLQSTGIQALREAAADSKKDSRSYSVSAPSYIKPDFWSWDGEEETQAKWAKRKMQLLADGYSIKQADTILHKGIGPSGGWYTNRDELEDAIKNTIPKK